MSSKGFPIHSVESFIELTQLASRKGCGEYSLLRGIDRAVEEIFEVHVDLV